MDAGFLTKVFIGLGGAGFFIGQVINAVLSRGCKWTAEDQRKLNTLYEAYERDRDQACCNKQIMETLKDICGGG